MIFLFICEGQTEKAFARSRFNDFLDSMKI